MRVGQGPRALGGALLQAFPLPLEPALELGGVAHEEPLEQPAAVQRQSLGRLTGIDRRLERPRVAPHHVS